MEPKRLQSKAWSCSDLVRAAATVVDMSAPPAQMVLQKEMQEAAEELQGKTAKELLAMLQDCCCSFTVHS